jgi:hypothetical protein
MGIGLVNGFIDHLYPGLRTTSTYKLSLIYIFYKLPQHHLSLFPACCGYISLSLATASNSRDFSFMLSGSIFTAPHAELKSQLTTPSLAAISHQPLSLLFTGWLPTDRVTPIVFRITTLHRPSRKHHFQL